jgi:TorA maturation chaperone TorD
LLPEILPATPRLDAMTNFCITSVELYQIPAWSHLKFFDVRTLIFKEEKTKVKMGMQANRMQETAETAHAGMSGAAVALVPLSQEDQARADFYALIARLLFAAPDEHLRASLAAADSLSSRQADNPLELAWEKLILTAGIMDVYALEDEFNELFISAGTPRFNPYASLYLTGFINEKPLAALRTELARLGLARVPGVSEMEDHLAALCETMRTLITGGPGGKRQSVHCQKLFFEKHIAPWASQFLDDMSAAAGANFYRQVADFAQAFFLIESQAFDIGEECAGQ